MMMMKLASRVIKKNHICVLKLKLFSYTLNKDSLRRINHVDEIQHEVKRYVESAVASVWANLHLKLNTAIIKITKIT